MFASAVPQRLLRLKGLVRRSCCLFAALDNVLQRCHLQFLIEGHHALLHQFVAVEVNRVNGLLVDSLPELLELLLGEVVVQLISLRLSAIRVMAIAADR